MNILPHKSWHVRTKKNIARFRRDEERAKQEEEELQRRISLAEHEARIRQLKRQAGIEKSEAATEVATSSGRFDLFQDFKDKTDADSEKSAEKKVEQERWEVRQGIFSYLDGRYKYDGNQSSANNDSEWYLKSHEERMNIRIENNDDDDGSVASRAKVERVKCENDPLRDMSRYLEEMRKRDDPSCIVDNQTKDYGRKRIKVESSDRSTTIEKKKSKKKKKSKRSPSPHSECDNEEAKMAFINRLRAERLERERRERERTQALLRKSAASTSAGTTDTVGGVKQKYNSQFNPHIARQNMTDD